MVGEPRRTGVDYVLTADPEAAAGALDRIAPIYEAAYAGPPYNEGLDDFADFRKSWPRRTAQPAFRLALATADDRVIGFAFGHGLTNDDWWDGAVDRLDVDTVERPGRTLAIIEIAVLADYRGGGVGRQLHDLVLNADYEERATLLVRPEPEVESARRLYRSSGYRKVGQMIPYNGAPLYDVMVRVEHNRKAQRMVAETQWSQRHHAV